MGESSLALAEEAMLLEKLPEAKFHAGQAVRDLPSGSPSWLQAEDILLAARQRDQMMQQAQTERADDDDIIDPPTPEFRRRPTLWAGMLALAAVLALPAVPASPLIR